MMKTARVESSASGMKADIAKAGEKGSRKINRELEADLLERACTLWRLGRFLDPRRVGKNPEEIEVRRGVRLASLYLHKRERGWMTEAKVMHLLLRAYGGERMISASVRNCFQSEDAYGGLYALFMVAFWAERKEAENAHKIPHP